MATPVASTSSGGPLKPGFLSTPGEPPMTWEMWLRLFNDHLLAHNLDTVPEKRKLAILRSSLGAEGYRICADLCSEADISYDVTISRLEQRFQPPPSQILTRVQFNRRVQQSSEDTAQFATALRALAAKCGYPDAILNELVRDRVVAGCRDEKIRERLLQEPNSLTLDVACKLAQTLERAFSETKAVTESLKPVVDRVAGRTGYRSSHTDQNGTRSERHPTAK